MLVDRNLAYDETTRALADALVESLDEALAEHLDVPAYTFPEDDRAGLYVRVGSRTFRLQLQEQL